MQHSALIKTAIIVTVAIAITTSCNQPIIYPAGGYDYPAKDSVTNDSFYHCPLKTVFSRWDSFWAAYDYVPYKAFDEPNLSLKPAGKDISDLCLGGFTTHRWL